MKNTVLKYGLLSGLVLAILSSAAVLLQKHCGSTMGMVIGYTIMVLSFLLIFVGVKHYRDHQLGGTITFRRAAGAGALMMLVSCVCYVLMWEAMMHTVEKDFAQKYSASLIQHAKDSGLSGDALQKKVDEAHKFETMYAKPIYRMSLTLLEPLPVDIVLVLVSAAILRRKPEDTTSYEAVPAS